MCSAGTVEAHNRIVRDAMHKAETCAMELGYELQAAYPDIRLVLRTPSKLRRSTAFSVQTVAELDAAPAFRPRLRDASGKPQLRLAIRAVMVINRFNAATDDEEPTHIMLYLAAATL